MAALTVGADHADTTADRGLRCRSPARTTGPAGPADRSPAIARAARTVRAWPLLVLAAPAAAEVWSGWVGIAEKTGFGQVSPLPGIWPSPHLDTTITLPVGVEAYAAYAAYALRAWLASEDAVSPRTRRFAKLWALTTIMSCLPVLVLAMGTTLAHMLRADAAAADAPDSSTRGPAAPRSPAWSREDQAGPGPDHATDEGTPTGSGPPAETRMSPRRDHRTTAGTTTRGPQSTQREMDRARLIARRLAATGKPVSRRALRSGGVRGSNAALNSLARKVNAELADKAAPLAQA